LEKALDPEKKGVEIHFVDMLKAKGYLQLLDPLWGHCLIIGREEFTDKMALCLRIEGIRYHFTLLDNYGAVFVELESPSVPEHTVQLAVLEVNY
jgi:hypothetical protein